MNIENLSIDEMQNNAAAAERLLKSLANHHRLMILCHLVGGELSVGELEKRVGLSQSSLSQHLAKMRGQNILSFRREGTTVLYSIKDQKALQVLESLHGIYCS